MLEMSVLKLCGLDMDVSASFRFEYAEEASSWDVSGEKVQSIKLRIRRMHLSSLSTEKRVYIEHVIPLCPLSKWMNHSILKRRKVTNKLGIEQFELTVLYCCSRACMH